MTTELMFLLFVATAAIVFTAVAVWVYKDAKIHSRHSPLLWGAAVFFGGFFGLGLYFWVGRPESGARNV